MWKASVFMAWEDLYKSYYSEIGIKKGITKNNLGVVQQSVVLGSVHAAWVRCPASSRVDDEADHRQPLLRMTSRDVAI